MRRGTLAALSVAALILGMTSAAALAAPRAATPQLIEEDVRSKRIPRARGHLYLAYAFYRPEKLPAAYRSTTPWHGTLPLWDLKRAVERMPDGATKREIESVMPSRASASASEPCGSAQPLPNKASSEHFYVEYGTIEGGLTIADYLESLEVTRSAQVEGYGWAAPPPSPDPVLGGRYYVRIEPNEFGAYGFADPTDLIGDNPATAWNEGDAIASCLVLHNNYALFPGTPRQALDATTAHEFNHSIQFGLGALDPRPDQIFVEGGATWMEEETHDSADDNYNYLWPPFELSMSRFSDSGVDAYAYWLTWRGMTEPFGTNVSGGGEDVMQAYWELESQNIAHQVDAMDLALQTKGTNLPDAFHAYSIAAGLMRTCGDRYVLPYCFEEAWAYPGVPSDHATIETVGGSVTRSLENEFAINWIELPTPGAAFSVELQSTDPAGGPGKLRSTVVCDTGSELVLTPLELVTDARSARRSFDSAGCVRMVLSVTNETRTVEVDEDGDGHYDTPEEARIRNFIVKTGEPVIPNLTVSMDGDGTGSVSSIPDGITCGSTCSAAFFEGTVVALSPLPDADSTFVGWSGACSGTDICTLTMSEARAATATFARKRHALTITRVGPGSVISTPQAVNCGGTCTGSFVHGTVVTLAPVPAGAAKFAGWSGACTGTGPCQVTMTEARNVGAGFTAAPVLDTVAPFFSILGKKLRATKRGRIGVRIACAGGEVEGCNGTLRLGAARASFRIAGGGEKRIRVRLSRSARRRLARSRRIRVRVTVTVKDAAGNTRTRRRTFTVRR